MAPSSPLHASFPESSRHNRTNSTQQHASTAHSLLLPGSGSGSGREERSGLGLDSPRDSPAASSTSTSRQTRRLHLRNAGFQAATVPTRKVTPSLPSLSTSTNWSSISGLQQSSDAENVSPSGKRASICENSSQPFSLYDSNRESSGGVLQDIGNSATIRQPKRARPRVTSGKFWMGESKDTSLLATDDVQSPPSSALSNTARPRSVRTRAKMPRSSRRSVSAETRRYVDHLEQQLVEAQEQLSVATSPTHTREQSSRMRHLNAETKHLQEELAAWEAKYEERVQEELDKHFQLESDLRSRVRTLEAEADGARYRIEDLEVQLEERQQNMDAVETANVNLEKRLEIMSELLAASPNKIDLHAETPGRPRQGRPKSMMPRFPTAGSLAISPDRYAQTQPGSPSPSHASVRFSPGPPISPVNLSFSPEVASSDDDDCNNSEASMSMSSVIHAPDGVKKPYRRMRRFGAGSIGPKPLILPSTSNAEQFPASALPREYDEGPAFPFHARLEAEMDGSSPSLRRRSSSEANQKPKLRLSTPPHMAFESSIDDVLAGAEASGLGSPPTSRLSMTAADLSSFRNPPGSRLSMTTNITRDLSSIGSGLAPTAGRNLMEELTAVRTRESYDGLENSDGAELSSDPPGQEAQNEVELASSPFNSDVEEDVPPISCNKSSDETMKPPVNTNTRLRSASSTAIDPATAVGTLEVPRPKMSHSRSSSRSLSVTSSRASLSTLDSLRTIFSNMFQSPVELAKHLIQTAQSRMRIPRSLLTVQWWLVGVLLGPMARKRWNLLASKSTCCSSTSAEQRSLLDTNDPVIPDEPPEQDSLAYGSAYRTPESAPSSPVRARSLTAVAGKGKKRAKNVDVSPCPDHPHRYKHSPILWLKFSMTLAIAVGVAFKDGPSSLLKEAVCSCKRSRRLSGTGCANWRGARRDEIMAMTPVSKSA